jgi:hypothetical protein
VSFLYGHSWLLFVISEGATWVLVFFLFFCRYWLRFDRVSKWLFKLIVLINVFQIFLGIIDYYYTGKISFFQIVIVLFITYACTLGSSDFQRLDQYIKEKWSRGSGINRTDLVHHEDIRLHMAYRKWLFFLHTTAFTIIHYLWFKLESSRYSTFGEFMKYVNNGWFQHIDQAFFTNSIYYMISYVWSMIYAFDFIVIFMYLFLSRYLRVEE